MEGTRAKIVVSSEIEGERPVRVTADGIFAQKGTVCYARYHEDEKSGMAGSSTLIKWDAAGAAGVTVIRHGSCEMRQEFMPGVPFSSIYRTESLEMPMGVYPLTVRTEAKKDSWRLYLVYDLDLAGEKRRFRVKIKVSPEAKRDEKAPQGA